MLKDIKFYFETMFQNNWTQTEVHYAGQEFDPTALNTDTWVNPVFKPLRISDNGLSDSSSVVSGMLYIVCWAKNDVEVMELADDVIDFVRVNVDRTLFKARKFSIIDHGWDDTNKAFMVVSVDIEQRQGTCIVP